MSGLNDGISFCLPDLNDVSNRDREDRDADNEENEWNRDLPGMSMNVVEHHAVGSSDSDDGDDEYSRGTTHSGRLRVE